MKRLVVLFSVVLAAGLIWFLMRGNTPPDEASRNRTFAESMQGVVLTGYSTRLNRPGLSGEERYYIDSVTHVSGDTWLFKSRFEHGGREIPVPIPLTVRWAGDTPVITMTDLSIPGVGTYTVRIVLYRDQYAGTWSADREGVGGQMFGKIVRTAKTP